MAEQGAEKASDSVAVRTLTETRRYELNKGKTMKKKLAASTNEVFQLTETGGGVKLTLNAGMYELFRHSADEYFQHCSDESSCKKSDVLDKAGNIVESKYKVSTRKSGHYMLNMYHTTTSCLVNGRNTSKFLDADLQNIFSIIDKKVSREDCSIDDFNSSIREMILIYLESDEPDIALKQTTDSLEKADSIKSKPTEQLPIDILNTDPEGPTGIRNSNMTRSTQTETDMLHASNQTESTPAITHTNQSTQTTNKTDMSELVTAVFNEIVQLKQTMDKHIESTNTKFDRICDQITHVKKQLTVSSSSTDRALEDLDCKHNNMQSGIQKTNDNIQKRLQGIFDSLKNLHNKNIVTQATSPQMIAQHEISRPTEPSSMDVHVQTPASSHYSVRNAHSPSRIQTTHTSTGSTEPLSRIPPRNKTLIIGDSIIKGIQPRGLNTNVDCRTCPGAIITDLGKRIEQLDMRVYSKVAVYVGGNDVSSGLRLGDSRAELLRLTRHIQRQQCEVYVCTISPRQDADVRGYNSMVKEICEETGANVIETNPSFVYGDGNMVRHYFTRDGIHLSEYGSRTLVKAINQRLQITKPKGRSNTGTRQAIHSATTDRDLAYSHYYPRYNRHTFSNQSRFRNTLGNNIDL